MYYEIKTVGDVLNLADKIIEKVENDPLNDEIVIINMSSLVTEDLSPPASRITGADSPVIADSSIVQCPQ